MLKSLLVICVAATAACAVRPSTDTTPRQFDCNGTQLEVGRAGNLVVTRGTTTMALDRSHRDDDGNHFSARQGEPVEYIVPDDRHADAIATNSLDRSRTTCVAIGGYSDALQRFMRTKNHHAVAAQLSLADDDARRLIHEALFRLQRQYYANR